MVEVRGGGGGVSLTVVVKEGEDWGSCIPHRGLDLTGSVLLGSNVGIGLEICLTFSDTFKMSYGASSFFLLSLKETTERLFDFPIEGFPFHLEMSFLCHLLLLVETKPGHLLTVLHVDLIDPLQVFPALLMGRGTTENLLEARLIAPVEPWL